MKEDGRGAGAQPEPLVSAVIPARNAERYIGEALESVLAQTYPRIEVIVVDDGSTDATGALAAGFGDRVRCIEQPPLGVSRARNRGVEETSGELMAFLDADDVWQPAKIERQVEAIRSRGLDMVFGQVEEFVSPELDPALASRMRSLRESASGMLISAMTVTRDSFSRVGPFDERWRIGQWVEWGMRAIEAGLRWEVLPEILVRRRLHGANSGLQEGEFRHMYVEIVKEMLDRRRGAEARGESS